ncbi:YihA family ribosome biogenesis GTP-binding protein [Flaviaesturariibacter flavus]|uniref:Probable GTP-binding protein EngB n=1 Tax=Flaviaesturariibacter flavus TaxID=2502780 RepID=A0A4R1B5F3_9BACT|nr:ribosome biogenesis GTP-binding protein YihA/YsxC [Flaviaesturariibacter flavus]TCJ13362.1 YihA family ribosome biogenesis GTP-binding protein [Flaviaesturariibacter flavus]
MEIVKAEYLISSPSIDLCPKGDRPEYAFIGRSNVGKSSLINALTGKKELAKVSRTPGKTQLINHFTITPRDGRPWYLVDLPGYGFAKRSQALRKEWSKMIENYIRKRESLVFLFVLIDSRHEPQDLDLEFINQLGEWQVPFALAFTKSDKTTQREVAANVRRFIDTLLEKWEEPPPYFVTSAEKRTGVRQILSFIHELNERYEKEEKKKVK